MNRCAGVAALFVDPYYTVECCIADCGRAINKAGNGMEGRLKKGKGAQSSQNIISSAECSKNLRNNKQYNKSRGPRESKLQPPS